MLLKNLQLINFRNYSKFDLDFTGQPTIFVGPNGAGKSNILEAILLLSTTKSARVEQENEIIKDEAVFTSISGKVTENGDQNELLITMVKDVDFQKRLVVNGVGKRVMDFIGVLPTVIFWPSDINMVTGSPALRRWHLDLSLAQIDGNYKRSLTMYEQVVTARNKVLKRVREGQGRLDELTYWTDELIKDGAMIAKKRQEFFDFVNKQSLPDGKIKNPLGNFKFNYLPSELSIDRIASYNGREIAAAVTLIGPHRDDFALFLGKRNMAKFGSRGEQRMATLAFKLAILEYMAKILGKRPVLLLDDVFSELDARHRAVVASIANLQQTIIATVELENIPQEFLDSSRILKVEQGKIS